MTKQRLLHELSPTKLISVAIITYLLGRLLVYLDFWFLVVPSILAVVPMSVVFLVGLMEQHLRVHLLMPAIAAISLLAVVGPVLIHNGFGWKIQPLAAEYYCLALAADIGGIYVGQLCRRLWGKFRKCRAGTCPGCGYCLKGLPSNVCPECGREFSQAEAKEGAPVESPGSKCRSPPESPADE